MDIAVSRLRLRLARQAAVARAYRRLLRGTRALVVESGGHLYAVDPEDFGVGRELRRPGGHGADEVHRIVKRLGDRPVVLVVGAHVGTLAIPLADHCRRVVAVEANPRTFELLRMSIRLNEADNCVPLQFAASDRMESIDFLLSRANSGGAKRVPKHRRFEYVYDRPEVVPVAAERLDDRLGEEGFDAIVMDIEGSEYLALKGSQTILAEAELLAIEFVPHHLRDVAGVSVEEFVAQIAPHFDRLTVPSKGITVERDRFVETLTAMCDAGEADDGLIFEKAGPA